MGQGNRKRHALAEVRRRFRAALAYRGQTAEEFARSIEIGANHLSLVLNGHRESQRVLSLVEDFTATVEREVAKKLGGGSAEPKIQQAAA